MAKAKKQFGYLKCKECNRENYITLISKQIKQLEIRKYCKHCNKHTLHKLKRKD